MAELIGLLVSGFVLALIFLPLLTFLRVGRLQRDLGVLSQRVSALERRQTPPVEAPDAPAPEPATSSVDPPPTPTVETATLAPAPGLPAEAVASRPDSLEERIGGRGLLYAGVTILFLGVSFFLKYAFDNDWIDETGRSVLGVVGGVALVGIGRRLARGGLGTFGHVLTGTGFAVLYLVTYVAFQRYGLIGQPAAFAAMVTITIACALVAHRGRSQSLAFVAVAGGLVTPALSGGDRTSQLTLFTYDALVIAGTVALSWTHRWLALNAVSYAGVVVTVFVWLVRFYSDDEWLRTVLFLTLFCVMFLLVLKASRSAPGWIATLVRAVLWTAPVLYHATAVVLTASHPPAVHLYLIAFTVVGLWFTVDPHRPIVRLAILLGAFIPLFGTLTLPDGRSWLAPNLIVIGAVTLLHVLALVDRSKRQGVTLGGVDLLTLHVAGIGLFGLLDEALQPAYPEFRGALAALLAIGALTVRRVLHPTDSLAALHALGLVFVLAALGVAVQFDGEAAVVGWAVEGAVAVWLGVHSASYAFQMGGTLLWVFAALRLIDTFSFTLAGFTVLFNQRTAATLLVVALGYVMARRLRRAADATRMRWVLHILTSIVTLWWITAEIRSFWDVRFEQSQAYFYEQMLLSLAWGVYGAVLIAIGFWSRHALSRYLGMTIIVGTALKVFFYDLWELGGIFRVAGFISLGLLLVLVSYLYQRRAVAVQSAPPPPSAPPSPPPSPLPSLESSRSVPPDQTGAAAASPPAVDRPGSAG